MKKPIGTLICKVIGHRFDIVSMTGRFQWCSRCALRRAGPGQRSLAHERDAISGIRAGDTVTCTVDDRGQLRIVPD